MNFEHLLLNVDNQGRIISNSSPLFHIAPLFKKQNKKRSKFYTESTIKNIYLWLRCTGVLDRTSDKMLPFLFIVSKNERHLINPL